MTKRKWISILFTALIFGVFLSAFSRHKMPILKNDNTSPDLLAIDVLLEPDAAVIKEAQKANARLMRNYPQGFALDESHRPHITLAQRYIRADDLPAVTTALSKLFTEAKLKQIELRAQGYYTNATTGIGFCVMAISLTPALAKLQQDVIDVLQPFSMPGGTADAFIQNENHQPIDSFTVKYVNRFVPDYSGEKFSPHVSIGLAHADYLQQLMRSAFKVITFKPSAAALFQLGDFGTARKELWRVKSGQ